MKIKLIVEYEGSAFRGWQMQGELPTVQRELSEAIGVYLRSLAKQAGLDEKADWAPLVTGSGRTDSGVHARGQVASFPWPEEIAWDKERFLRAINGITATPLAVLSAEAMPDTFDARFTPHTKCYIYRLLMRPNGSRALHHGRVWHIQRELDVKPMIAAAHLLRGTHDFRAFRAADCMAKTTIRTVERSEISRPSPEEILYIIHGTGFLKQMVRIIAGTLVVVGLGKLEPQAVAEILAAGDRGRAGETAPASGLTLEWVKYFGD